MKGVSWDKRIGKYQAYAWVANAKMHLGYFETYQEAAAVRQSADDDVQRRRESHKEAKCRPIFIDQSDSRIAYVQLTRGQRAIIDSEDIPCITGRQWTAERFRNGRFYARNQSGLLSRCILGITDPSIHVDHINHDTLDNRKLNLRAVSPKRNNWNHGPRVDNRVGYPGIHWHEKDRKWVARIQANGKRVQVGSFHTLEDAVSARKSAELEWFGEQCRSNDPVMR